MFDKYYKHFDLCHQELESYVLLRCLKSDIDILGSQLVPLNLDNTLSVWATEVSISLYEDIIDKLGVDSDVIVCGATEIR